MGQPEPEALRGSEREFHDCDDLTRRLLRVPKEELDRAVATDTATKQKRAS
jgi:hypothetical protein